MPWEDTTATTYGASGQNPNIGLPDCPDMTSAEVVIARAEP